MKKLLSIVLSLIIAVCACTAFAIPALAVSVRSPGGTVVHVANDPLVNGKESNKVTGNAATPGESIITFTYTGNGTLKGWEIIDKNGNTTPIGNGDNSYRIVSQDGNTLVIEVLDWDKWESPDGYTVNALVEGETSEGTSDGSGTSPNTGAVSVAFASMAAAGAGVAILGLTKKKDAE